MVQDDDQILPTRLENPFIVGGLGSAAGLRKLIRAEALSPKKVGAVAFSRTGDPATGDFSEATVLRKFGEVPDDLIAL